MDDVLGNRKDTIEFFLEPGFSFVRVSLVRSEVLELLTVDPRHSLLLAGVILTLKKGFILFVNCKKCVLCFGI